MGKADILFMLSAKGNGFLAKQLAEQIAFHSTDDQPFPSNISKIIMIPHPFTNI